MKSLCNNWEFVFQVTDAFLQGMGQGDSVRLPHTVKELPLHYPDHQSYETVCGYRRTLDIPETMRSKRLFLQLSNAKVDLMKRQFQALVQRG